MIKLLNEEGANVDAYGAHYGYALQAASMRPDLMFMFAEDSIVLLCRRRVGWGTRR